MKVALNNVFMNQSKEYQSKPVKAARYQQGMENGFMIYITGINEANRNDAMKFFDTKEEAESYIKENPKQYMISDDGTKICASVKYDEPRPVIYHRLLPNEESDYKFPLEVKALLSDESNDCEWCGLSSDSWIIVEDNGNVRVWEYSSCEDFFGENSVCEKVNEKTYIEVAV